MTRVSLAYARHAHHARWSGYPRVAEHLPGLVRARRVRPTPLPVGLRRRLANGVRSGWYGPDQADLDLAVARRLATGRREVVHLLYGEHGHHLAGRVGALARRRGNRLVATFHQPPPLFEEIGTGPELFGALDHVIALGPRAADHLAGVVGARHVSRAFLGVDVEAWCPGGERAPAPICAFVGSWFRDLDGLESVVAAVREASPGVRFEAVTSVANARRMDGWPGLTVRTGVSDEALRDLYRRAWVHVLPLTDAVACNGLLEGMACGLPTVASAVGDVESYTGDAAVLTPPGDAPAMAEALVELLGDAPRRERLGRSARARAEHFSLSRAARRHAEIYEAVATLRPA